MYVSPVVLTQQSQHSPRAQKHRRHHQSMAMMYVQYTLRVRLNVFKKRNSKNKPVEDWNALSTSRRCSHWVHRLIHPLTLTSSASIHNVRSRDEPIKNKENKPMTALNPRPSPLTCGAAFDMNVSGQMHN